MALKLPLLSRLSGTRAALAAVDLLARLEDEGAARLGLAGRAARVWTRLARLVRALPGPVAFAGAALLVAPALVAPEWFAARLAVLDTLPEALWWLAGAGLSLVFGIRFQAEEQAFVRELIDQAAPPEPLATAATGTDAVLALGAAEPGDNPPLQEWLAQRQAR